MIKLVFSIGRETFFISIHNKEVWYVDRKWIKGIRLIPSEKELTKKIIMSRNTFPKFLIDLVVNIFDNDKEREVYEKCIDDSEVSEMIIKDVKKLGGKLVKNEFE